MHLAINLFVIFSVFKWGKYRQWKEYHSTMIFLAATNLLYNFLCSTKGHFLWKMHPDFLANHFYTEIIYSIILLPGTVLIFLSNLPNERKKQLLHIAKWVFIYIAFEFVFFKAGRISYEMGWNLFRSFIFDIIII